MVKRSALGLSLLGLCWFVSGCAGRRQQTNPYKTLSGVVLRQDGTPLVGGTVSLYLNDSAAFRGPANYNSLPTDTAGKYKIELLPVGKYYVVARRRQNGRQQGPLRTGDYNGICDQNPIILQVDTQLTLEVVEVTGTLLSPEKKRGPSDGVRLEGQVVDQNGQALPGMYVLLYLGPEMSGMPAQMVGPTTADGRFRVVTAYQKRLYLAVRSRYGGPPRPQELYGRYQSGADKYYLELSAPQFDSSGVGSMEFKGLEISASPFVKYKQEHPEPKK